jgi:hypothetical protein
MNLSTIVPFASGVSDLNVTMASSRLRNSGLKTRLDGGLALPAAAARAIHRRIPPVVGEPDGRHAHLARTGVGREDEHGVGKSAFRPVLSVSVA